jgi:hypothetical protein
MFKQIKVTTVFDYEIIQSCKVKNWTVEVVKSGKKYFIHCKNEGSCVTWEHRVTKEATPELLNQILVTEKENIVDGFFEIGLTDWVDHWDIGG